MAYVYIKATEGETRIDPKYEQNVLTAHRYGLKVGSYHFYRPTVPQETQVANFFAQCKPSEQDLIPMIDVEVTGGLSTEALCDSLFKFLYLVEQVYRQRPLIYVGTNFYNKHFQGKLDRYLLMVAQYSERLPVLADVRTSHCGNIPEKDTCTASTAMWTRAVSWDATSYAN
jgi:lysozyme